MPAAEPPTPPETPLDFTSLVDEQEWQIIVDDPALLVARRIR